MSQDNSEIADEINKLRRTSIDDDCESMRHEISSLEGKLTRAKSDYKECDNPYPNGKDSISLLKLLQLVKETPNVYDLLNSFPYPPQRKGVLVTRAHVYEALWRLIYFLQLDDQFKKGYTRTILKSVESGKIDFQGLPSKQFLSEEEVNGGNRGGIADLYFEDNTSGHATEIKSKKFVCEDEGNDKLSNSKYYLFSSKFYKNDFKKNVTSYDIDNIYVEALDKHQESLNLGVFVNDVGTFKNKLSRSRKAMTRLLDPNLCFGIGDLHTRFYSRLYNTVKNINLDSDFSFGRHITSPVLQPRLHQELFINRTKDEIGNLSNPRKQTVVWGAVPRSGKSYMIAGLIEQFKPQLAIIILGAVSETHGQFYDIFNNHSGSFPVSEYSIIDVKDKRKDRFSELSGEKKNILIISQQLLWRKEKDKKELVPIKAVKDALNNANENTIVFYDEIHQGAGTEDGGQDAIVQEYLCNKEKGNLRCPLVMVTATFLKPLLKYNNVCGVNASPFVMQWTYDMMQNMKNIANEQTQQLMLDLFRENIEEHEGIRNAEEFKRLLVKYVETGYSLDDLQNIYIHEPILTIVAPDIETYNSEKDLLRNDSGDVDVAGIFINLSRSGRDDFKAEIIALLKHIRYNVYDNRALIRNGFDVGEQQHSQLWFLPTTLRGVGVVDKIMGKLISVIMTSTNKTCVWFRDHFCFIPMHSNKANKENYEGIDLGNKLSNVQKCYTTESIGTKDIRQTLMDNERTARTKNPKKSVIILTAGQLRLGVSLPCVDIALHMDPIESADTIYQSMFRVLTPAPGKERGYFVDMLKTRMIKFLYNYENMMSARLKDGTRKTKLGRMRQLINSFDINGLSMQETTREYMNAYSNLISQLGLSNMETFAKSSIEYGTTSSNVEDLIADVFSDTLDTHLQKLSDRIGNIMAKKSSRGKIDETVMERGNGSKDADNQGNKADTPNKQTSKRQKKLSRKEMLKIVQHYFTNLLALYILLQDTNEADKNCDDSNIDSLKKWLDSRTKKAVTAEAIGELETLGSLCDPEQDGPMLECYLAWARRNSSLSKEEMATQVTELRSEFSRILSSILDSGITQKQRMINVYCDIRGDLMGLQKRHEEKLQSNSETCSEDEITNPTVLEIIRKRLVVREDEKAQHGEVFTPISLVCEMLDTLPKDVWSNPNLKWLDPANGIGNFPVICYYRLMKGLVDKIPNERERSRHIIDKMLYMVELNPVNARVCKKIFGILDSSAKPNIATANFLTGNWKKQFGGVEKFDIIMGNPPYNEGGIRQIKGKKEGRTIWNDFIDIAYGILTNNQARVCFLCPSSWTSLRRALPLDDEHFVIDDWSVARKRLTHVHFFNSDLVRHLFKSAEIPLAFFCIENITVSEKDIRHSVLIYDPDGNNSYQPFQVYKYRFIPQRSIALVNYLALMTDSLGALDKHLINGGSTGIRAKQFKTNSPYPIVRMPLGEIVVDYSSINRNTNSLPKLVLANFSMGNPLYDKFGILQPDTAANSIIQLPDKMNNKKELRIIQEFLLSDIVRSLFVHNRVLAKFLNKSIFRVLPVISNYPNIDYTKVENNDWSRMLNLTPSMLKGVHYFNEQGSFILSSNFRNEILNFDITKHQNGMTMKQIEYTQNLIRKEQAELEQKRKDRVSKKANKTRKASKSTKAAEAAPAHDSKREGKGPSTRKARKPKVLRTRRNQRSKSSASTRRN